MHHRQFGRLERRAFVNKIVALAVATAQEVWR